MPEHHVVGFKEKNSVRTVYADAAYDASLVWLQVRKRNTCTHAPRPQGSIFIFELVTSRVRRRVYVHLFAHVCDRQVSAYAIHASFELGGSFSLVISTCDFDGAAVTGSDDTIQFFTCSGGPYCEVGDTPTKATTFDQGETQVLTINDDVEPTTLIISKPEGTDGW